MHSTSPNSHYLRLLQPNKVSYTHIQTVYGKSETEERKGELNFSEVMLTYLSAATKCKASFGKPQREEEQGQPVSKQLEKSRFFLKNENNFEAINV